eukprot:scaffold24080_cov48-Phaeocystis_antarctica.AAC.2
MCTQVQRDGLRPARHRLPARAADLARNALHGGVDGLRLLAAAGRRHARPLRRRVHLDRRRPRRLLGIRNGRVRRRRAPRARLRTG